MSSLLQSLAVLDYVGTDLRAQGKGHCTALLGGLGHLLGAGLGVASLVAVVDKEVCSQAVAMTVCGASWPVDAIQGVHPYGM